MPSNNESSWPVESLVQAAKNGDAASIATLVTTSHPHVQRVARTLCATPQDAEDAAQEALIVLYRRIGSLRATAAFSSWIVRIVRNECIRRSRLLLLGLRRAHDTKDRADDLRAADDVESDVLCRLEAGRIAEAIARLPADQRAVLIMRDVQDLPGAVVAVTLGLSKPAMKSRLLRARQALREQLS